MITLFFSTGQGENHYTVTSINVLRSNLKKFHKKDIKRRWSFQCLRYLIDEGYIRRKKRYVYDHNRLITQIPSMLWFTLKGVVWLVRNGVSGAKKVYKSMVKHIQSGDKRYPQPKEFDDGSYKPADPGEQKRLDGLLGIVTKKIS